MNPWKLTLTQLQNYLKSSNSGDPLVRLVDQLVKAHCWRYGGDLSQVFFAYSSTKGDQGMDGTVNVELSEPLGYFKAKTVWQLKTGKVSYTSKHKKGTTATGSNPPPPLPPSELEKEVLKVKDQLQNGYGYVLVTAGSYGANQREAMKKALTVALQKTLKLNAEDPVPFHDVIFDEDLLHWIELYPRICLEFHHPLADVFVHMESWGKMACSRTPNFVPLKSWREHILRIQNHVDLKKRPHSPILSVQGEPGVGKSRLVYEALKGTHGMEGVVVYMDQPSEMPRVINHLRNQEQASAVIVMDNCSHSTMLHWKKQLQGFEEQLRLITIGEMGAAATTRDDVVQVKLQDGTEVLTVIDQNFPTFPTELIKTISVETEGLLTLTVELAVELQRGHNPPINTLNEVHALLQLHLPDPEDLMAVLAVTLLDGQQNSMKRLETLLHEGSDWEMRLKRLENAVPFLQKSGQGWKVKPPIVEEVAFQDAMSKWARDSDSLMTFLNEEQKSSFLQQASKYANVDDRKYLGSLQWSTHKRQHDAHFLDEAKVARLVCMVQTDPLGLLPQVRYLQTLPRPDFDEAMVSGHSSATIRWLDLLAYCMLYPDLLDHAEALLLDRMSTDPRESVRQHACSLWLKAMALPDRSALPAEYRLERLVQYWAFGTSENSQMVLEALKLTLTEHIAGIESFTPKPGGLYPAVYQPNEWKTFVGKCWEMLVQLATLTQNPEWKEMARETIRSVIKPSNTTVRSMAAVDVALLQDVLDPDEILELQATPIEVVPRSGKSPELPLDWPTLGFMQKIQRFAEGELLFPHQQRNEPAWEALLTELGNGMLVSTQAFQETLTVLQSAQNWPAIALAEHVARVADQQVFLAEVLKKTESASSHFGLSYLETLLNQTDAHDGDVLEKMKDWEESHPAVVMSMLLTRVDRLGGLQRLLNMAETHHIPLGRLPSVQMHLILNDADFPAYVEKVLQGDSEDLKNWLVHLAWFSHLTGKLTDAELVEFPTLIPVVQRILEWEPPQRHSLTSKQAEVLRVLAPNSPEWALEWLMHRWSAVPLYDRERVLEALTAKHTEVLFDFLERQWANGKVPFGSDSGLILEILLHLPSDQLVEWLEKQPDELMQQVASVLPEPHVKIDRIVVPDLTMIVVDAFDANEKFREAFCWNRKAGGEQNPENGRPIWHSYLFSPWMTLQRWAATVGELPLPAPITTAP